MHALGKKKKKLEEAWKRGREGDSVGRNWFGDQGNGSGDSGEVQGQEGERKRLTQDRSALRDPGFLPSLSASVWQVC